MAVPCGDGGGASYVAGVASITTETLAGGLPVHRVALDGTRALTILLAFDAGARAERAEENGIAHFLEHLVFKGGEKYDHYKKVNETAERMGGTLNAYTSHDLVAFHITVRAEAAPEALDLLTDFVGRPRLDPDEIERERGVVIQEIQRHKDQPASVAEALIDEAAFGDHPLGRTVLGPEEHLRAFTRDQIVAFRERRWGGAGGGAFFVGNVDHVPSTEQVEELLARFPALDEPEPVEPAPALRAEKLVHRRDTNQSHLRLMYPAPIDPRDRAQRAALTIYATLLGGSMGSRLFDEIREQRGLAYAVYSFRMSHADAGAWGVYVGTTPAQAETALELILAEIDKVVKEGITADELERAKGAMRGGLALSLEDANSRMVRLGRDELTGAPHYSVDERLALIDAVTLDDIQAVAAEVMTGPLVMGAVGPFAEGELDRFVAG